MADWEQASGTATNKATGERMANVGGKWVPIEASATNAQTGEKRVRIMPKAGWSSSLGNAVMKGASDVGAVPSLIAGGAAELVGARGTSEKLFKSYENIKERGKEMWKPKGWQSPIQKGVGELVGGLAVPLAAGGGNPALLATTSALNTGAENVKGGMSAKTAMPLSAIQGAGNMAGMRMPLSIGGGIPGVLKAAAAQGGVAGAEKAAETEALLLDKDPESKKRAAKAIQEFLPSVGLSALFNIGGAGLVKIIQTLGKPAVQKVKAAIAGKGAAPSTPAGPNAAPAPVAAAPTVNAGGSAGGGAGAPVPKPAAAPAAAETEAQKLEREMAAWEAEMSGSGAGDLSDVGAFKGGGVPAAAPAAAPAPVAAAGGPVNREANMPPILLAEGDLYGQHPLDGLTDFDRAALVTFSPAYQPKEMTPQQVVDAITASGHTVEQAKAHGEAIEAEIVAKHNEMVKPDPVDGHWTDETRVREPINVAPPKAAEPPKAPDVAPLPQQPKANPELSIGGKVYEFDTPEKVTAYQAAKAKYDAARQANKEAGFPTKDLKKKFEAEVRAIAGAPDPARGKSPRQSAGFKGQTLQQAILKKGGITANEAQITGERMGSMGKGVSKSLFHKDGRELGELANELRADGWDIPDDPVDGGVAALREMIERDLKGDHVYDMATTDRQTAHEAQARSKDEAIQAEIDGLKAEAEAMHESLAKGVKDDPTDLPVAARQWEEKMQELAERIMKAGGTMAESIAIPGQVLARTGGAAALLVAAQSAKADDGSDTDASDWLTAGAIAVAVGGTVAFKNKDALGRAFTTVQKDFVRKLMTPMVETGAKRVVDQWRGYAAKAGIAAVRGAEKIKAEGAGKSLIELSQNKPFNEMVKFIADQYQGAKFKNATNMGVRLNAAIDHWDLTDSTTLARLEDFRNNVDPAIDFPQFHYENGFAGIEAGLRLGMKLKGKDSGEVFAQMAVGAFESIARGKMIRDLKELKLPNGKAAMVSLGTGQLPPDFNSYKRIGDSWGGTLADLEGWRIHPDLVNDFKLSFNTYEPGNLARSLMGINLAAKRSKVGGSLFHSMSLVQAKFNDVLGRALGGEMPDMDGIGTALKMLREGGGPMYGNVDGVMLLAGEGLRLDSPIEAALGKESAYRFLTVVQDGLNKAIPLSGTVTAGAIREADKAIQHFTWDYAQTGFKVMTALKELEAQVAKRPNEDVKKIAAEVAEYTNDIFGSIDWRRIGYQMNSRWGRNAAAEMFSGKGKFWMDMAMFAPDWFFATARSWLKALPGYENGKIKWDDQNRLYGRYLLGGLTAYIGIGEALNYAMSGHGMEDNKPTKKNPNDAEVMKAKMMIDRGDGTFIQLSKHFTDFPDVMLEPGKAFFNKMGTVPATTLQLASNKEYLGTDYAPPVSYSKAPGYASLQGMKDVGSHLGRAMLPISGQQAFTGTGEFNQQQLERTGLGFFGMPVRGYNADEKKALRMRENERKAAAK